MKKTARAVVVAATATASAVLPSAPAAAHPDSCVAVAAMPEVRPTNVHGSGTIACFAEHTAFTITICLQHSLVDVDALYTDQACRTWAHTGATSSFGAYADRFCPYSAGYWRTRVFGTADDHLAGPQASAPVLTTRSC